MMITNDRLVSDYLDRLRAATAGLPPGERDELVASIAEHIATSLAEAGEPTEADVRTILDRLGDPAAIAAEARGQSAAPPSVSAPAIPVRPGALEWAAVGVLGLGSYLIPVVGTVAGIVMVLLSRWWTGRQKAVAVVLSLSGLILVPLMLAGLALVQPSSEPDRVPAPAPTPPGVTTNAPTPPR